MSWPNGLALDVKTNRLYWSNSHTKEIEGIDLDGGNRHVVAKSLPVISPHGLTVLGKSLYFNDLGNNTLYQYNLRNNKLKSILGGLESPQDIKAFQVSS